MAEVWKKVSKNRDFTASQICPFLAFMNILINRSTLNGCCSQTTLPLYGLAKVRVGKLDSSWTCRKSLSLKFLGTLRIRSATMFLFTTHLWNAKQVECKLKPVLLPTALVFSLHISIAFLSKAGAFGVFKVLISCLWQQIFSISTNLWCPFSINMDPLFLPKKLYLQWIK